MKDYFDEEYVPEDIAYDKEDDESQEETFVNVDHELYGVSKPKRKIIKARVIK